MTTIAAPLRERPILFSGEMVRAIIEGRKTQTRRAILPQPLNPEVFGVSPIWGHGVAREAIDPQQRFGIHAAFAVPSPSAGKMVRVDRWLPCPFGAPGSHLWVRETLRGDGQPGDRRVGIARYAADGEMVLAHHQDWLWEWKRPVLPGIHMPRWASRLTLEIIGVRVERVQQIREEEAFAEGIQRGPHPASATEIYRTLWNSLNERRGYGWDVNPWVWVVEFRKLTA